MNGNQTPKRLRHAIVLALGLGISNVALSLGLGPINVKSYLGQPMFATIRVDGLNASSAKGMTVKLASPSEYKSRGIEMLPDHQQMRFALVPSGKGYVIRITSLGSIKEPFINFLLTISGNGSVVTREYAAFFNPDPTMEAGITGKPTVVASTPRRSVAVEKSHTEIKKVNPQTASGWGGNKTKSSMKPRKPESVSASHSSTSTKTAYSTPDSIPVGSSYGPIKPGETLYSIAKAARPSEAVSVHDMMRIIFNANRRAFSRGDMGNLMAGTTLYIPTPGRADTPPANTNATSGKRKSTAAVSKKKNEATEVNVAPPKEEQSVTTSVSEDNTTPSEDENTEKTVNDVISQTPGSATAQLVFGSANEPAETTPPSQDTTDTEMPSTPAQDSTVQETPDESISPAENNGLTLDTPESIGNTPASSDNREDNSDITAAETELPPPVIDMPATDNNITVPPADETKESAIEQPVSPPVVREQENIKVTPAPVAEEKSFFALPIPLLAGGLAGILALGGLAAFFWRKRKRKNDDSVEEFSQEDIDRMVAEMEVEHEQGDLDFDALSAAINNDSHAGSATEQQRKEELSDKTENIDFSDELPDDFFKDMDSPADDSLSGKNVETYEKNVSLEKPTQTPVEAAPEEYTEDDFFADLEFNQGENQPTPVTTTAKSNDDMDFLTDISEDLENDSVSGQNAQSSSPEDAKNTTSTQDDLSSDGDDFFADEINLSDKQQEKADDFADGLDFFTENEPSALEKEEAPSSPPTSGDDDLDFFLDEFPTDAKEDKPATETKTQENNLDFFIDDDDTTEESVATSDDSSAGLDFFMDEDEEDTAQSLISPEKNTEIDSDDTSLDFFSDEISEIDTPAETSPSKENIPTDIQNLFDKEDSVQSKTAPSVKSSSVAVDPEAMEINLDMATSFIAMGKNEKARSWLEEVLEVGTEEQKERAKAMLAQINRG